MFDREYYDKIKLPPPMHEGDVCPTCNGAQYVRYERPVSDFLFGKYTSCPRCAPVKREEESA